MATQLTCSQGHRWDSAGGVVPCPVCGASAMPFEEADTLPPSAQRVHPHEAPTLAPGERPTNKVVPAEPAPPPGLIGHSRYRVLEQLGVGGMGAVWKAEHQLMERHVALKVINRELTGDTAAIQRFHREVKAVAKLNHPNIVTAFDADFVGDTHFLVMEYVKGESLARVVSRRGPLSVAMACDCIRQAALGLQHAYEQGHIHRDIKPQNLMLTPEGQVKILDFGLARLATESRVAEPHPEAPASSKLGGEHSLAGFLTQAGVVMGTPDYIAPEQVSDPRQADIRADIYSLGCTFYHLLTGRTPFGGSSVLDKLVAHQEQVPRPVTEVRGDVPPEVVRILDRMLAKRPEDRYQTPAELVRDLEPLTQRGRLLPASRIDPARPAPSVLPATASVTPRVLPVVPPSTPPVPAKEGTRWTSLLGCLLVGLILLAAGVGGLIYAIQFGVDKVTSAVKNISSFVKEEQENDRLWSLVQEDWIPPPPGQPLDQLLPLNASNFSRGSIDSEVQPEGLGLNFPGRRATYSSFGLEVVVCVFEVPSHRQAEAFGELEQQSKQAAGGGQVSRRMTSDHFRRLHFIRGLPVSERVVAAGGGDYLFVAIGRNACNPDPVLIGVLRNINKKDRPPTPPSPPRADLPPLEPPESPQPINK